jgi:hypothetical protein
MTPTPLSETKPAVKTLMSFVDATARTHFQNAEGLAYRPDLLREGLREIRRRPEWAATLAGLAYWHRNGFAKIKIAEAGGLCMRLHIWPEGEDRLGDVDPHNHRWEFASWVAVGAGMQERRFTVVADDDPEGLIYTRCAYGRENGVDYLRPECGTRLREVAVFNRQPGHIYSCPPDVLHTVSPIGSGVVATMVLQGPRVKDSAEVYRCPERLDAALREPISAQELDQLFAQVEAGITAPKPVHPWTDW